MREIVKEKEKIYEKITSERKTLNDFDFRVLLDRIYSLGVKAGYETKQWRDNLK